MLIFSYYRISQQLTLNWRLTDWRLSTPVCYPDFSHTSLYNNTLHKYSDYRLVRVKICWPRNNPATALFWRIQGNEPPTWSSCLHCSTVLSVMLIFSYTSIPQRLTLSGRLTDWRLSMTVCYPDFSLTSLYDNTICKYYDYRLVKEKICWAENKPATALSWRIYNEHVSQCTVLSVVGITM